MTVHQFCGIINTTSSGHRRHCLTYLLSFLLTWSWQYASRAV